MGLDFLVVNEGKIVDHPSDVYLNGNRWMGCEIKSKMRERERGRFGDFCGGQGERNGGKRKEKSNEEGRKSRSGVRKVRRRLEDANA